MSLAAECSLKQTHPCSQATTSQHCSCLTYTAIYIPWKVYFQRKGWVSPPPPNMGIHHEYYSKSTWRELDSIVLLIASGRGKNCLSIGGIENKPTKISTNLQTNQAENKDKTCHWWSCKAIIQTFAHSVDMTYLLRELKLYQVSTQERK